MQKIFFTLSAVLFLALSCSPAEPPEVRRAVELELEKKFQEAANVLIKAEEENPENAAYPYHLGKLYNRNFMDFFKENIKTITIEDPEYRPLRESVMMQDTTGKKVGYILMDLHEVLQPFLRAIAKDPGLQEAYLEAASLYAEMNKMEEAHDMLEKGIDLFPRSHRFPFLKGFYYLHIRDYENAIALLEQAAAKDPKFSGSFRYLGDTLLEQGNTAKAAAAFQKVIDLNNDDTDVKHALSTMVSFFYEKQLYEEAAKWGIHNRRPLQRYPALLLSVGKAAYFSDLHKDAGDFLLAAYKAGHKDTFALALLGELSLENEQYSQAEQYFIESLDTRPRAQVFYQLGSLYLEKFDSPGRAIPALEEAIHMNPDYYPALFKLALAYEQAEQSPEQRGRAWNAYLNKARGIDNEAYIELAEHYLDTLKRK